MGGTGTSAERTKWGLNAGAFDKLLHALSNDRDAAGRRYEAIRAGLLQFFRRRTEIAAEALVDETIDRVCRRVEMGETLERVGPFFYGVARNVLREHLRTERRHAHLQREAAREHLRDVKPHEEEPFPTSTLAALQHCLRQLSDADRDLIERYYGLAADADAAAVRLRRTALAREMGISSGNLRVRAFRVRQGLEQCCRECLRHGEPFIEEQQRA